MMVRALLCTLLVATFSWVSHAEITVEGDDCFKNDAYEALNALRNSGSLNVTRMMADLDREGVTCKVSQIKTEANPHQDGGTVSWNPRRTGKGRYADGVCHDPYASLAHELRHCQVEKIPGTLAGDPREKVSMRTLSSNGRTSTVKGQEDAIKMENDYRQGAGLCMRRTAGSGLLAGVPASNVSPCPETFCPELVRQCDATVCCQITTSGLPLNDPGRVQFYPMSFEECRSFNADANMITADNVTGSIVPMIRCGN